MQTFKRILVMMVLSTMALGLFGFGIVIYASWDFNQRIARNIEQREQICETAVDRCNSYVIIGRAEAASPGSLFIFDQLRSPYTGHSRQRVNLWGIENSPTHAIHSMAVINDFIRQHGPWVVCWARHEHEHTCFGVGDDAPTEPEYYRQESDIALHLLEVGYARFSPDQTILPLLPMAYDPAEPSPRISSLYLTASGTTGAPLGGAYP